MPPIRLLAAAAAVTVLAGCGGGTNPGVRTATVERNTIVEVVEAPATVAPRARVTVPAAADGTVTSVAVRDGQAVKAGQVLLRLDSPAAQRRLRDARRADVQAASGGVRFGGSGLGTAQRQADGRARAGFAQARAAAQRIEDPRLRAQALTGVAAAQAQYEAASSAAQLALQRFDAGLAGLGEALASMAQAQRAQARSAVALAEQAVAALTVKAPISGVVSLGGTTGGGAPVGGAPAGGAAADIGQLPAQLQALAAGGGGASGDTIAAGVPVRTGQALVTVTDVSTLALTAEVDETDVLLVRPGVPADVELDALPDAAYRARVTSVDLSPAQSPRGGVSYRVRLALDGGTLANRDPAPAPRPGMSAVARLRVRTARDVLAVPASAVVRNEGRDAVWVVERDRAREREVTLGAQGEDLVEVRQGLRGGERIVVRGTDRLRDGQSLDQ